MFKKRKIQASVAHLGWDQEYQGQSQPGQIACEIPSPKQPEQKWTGNACSTIKKHWVQTPVSPKTKKKRERERC
jgi:hypothetical protein